MTNLLSRSSFISRYVLQLSSKNAAMIRIPPPMAAAESAWPPGRAQSTMATRKIVSLRHLSIDDGEPSEVKTYKAATEERTGEVKDIRTKKEPENAEGTSVLQAV